MPNEYPRSSRVSEQIKRELSALIATELKDPRAALAVVTDVEVSHNLAHARVYVAAADLAADSEASVRVLHHAAGFLRTRLAKNLRLRHIPRLQFIEDRTERNAAALDRLIDAAVGEDQQRHTDKDTG